MGWNKVLFKSITRWRHYWSSKTMVGTIGLASIVLTKINGTYICLISKQHRLPLSIKNPRANLLSQREQWKLKLYKNLDFLWKSRLWNQSSGYSDYLDQSRPVRIRKTSVSGRKISGMVRCPLSLTERHSLEHSMFFSALAREEKSLIWFRSH